MTPPRQPSPWPDRILLALAAVVGVTLFCLILCALFLIWERYH